MKNNKGIPEGNERKKWYEETLKLIGAVSVTKEEASEYYWQIVYDNMEPYADLLYVMPALAQRYSLYILTDEQVGENKPSPKLFQ